MKQFIEHLRLKRLRPKTIAAYESDIRMLLNFDRNLIRIREHLQSVGDSWHQRLLVTWTQYLEYIGDNYLKDFPKPRVIDKEPEVLSNEETDSFMGYIRSHYSSDVRIFCELALGLGMRASEVRELNEGSVRGDWLYIKRKGGKTQRLPLSKELASLLQNFKGVKLSHSRINIHIKKVAKAVGINRRISAHTLRHTFATEALKRGVSVVHIKEVLGHRSLNTTQKYVHVTPEDLRGVFNEG